MSYLVKILVERRKNILNPEAKVVEKATKSLDYNISNLQMGKYFSYESSKITEDEVREEADGLSKKLLSNPIIEDYKIISIEKVKN